MKNLFINASKDPHGTTEMLVKNKLGINDYQTINLVEYNVHPLGQENHTDDQFKSICDQIRKADNLILGTPVYWSSMSAYMKIFIDRMTSVMGDNNPFDHKNLFLVISGSAPADAIPHIQHVWDHIAHRFNMKFIKTVHN
ncbi:putative NAD(P)H-dependent FMN-containing oxidoreductase YwqN [Philodulcilactobacillus myokoensis]|uniref:NAD(P)H-dependent FMN-containing oxidoreductase YwqN n=1 Tax=Philodulcilactobacillus myokoensis TaxID=2929573 RepID=A0A9W6B3J8_9LACO|nr:flavodoxin family protein [Philodulcilactobacillus myokoensis]GLB47475.1 putative NAD(P)H-dependent FMN-containing oxidoreductase YwqN [Philodulcilactobacillus myokoensis]